MNKKMIDIKKPFIIKENSKIIEIFINIKKIPYWVNDKLLKKGFKFNKTKKCFYKTKYSANDLRGAYATKDEYLTYYHPMEISKLSSGFHKGLYLVEWGKLEVKLGDKLFSTNKKAVNFANKKEGYIRFIIKDNKIYDKIK